MQRCSPDDGRWMVWEIHTVRGEAFISSITLNHRITWDVSVTGGGDQNPCTQAGSTTPQLSHEGLEICTG